MEAYEGDWLPVESDAIAAVAYRAGSLIIRYRNGHVYRHSNVPKPLFDDLLSAESKGKFVNQYVKKTYPAKKL